MQALCKDRFDIPERDRRRLLLQELRLLQYVALFLFVNLPLRHHGTRVELPADTTDLEEAAFNFINSKYAKHSIRYEDLSQLQDKEAFSYRKRVMEHRSTGVAKLVDLANYLTASSNSSFARVIRMPWGSKAPRHWTMKVSIQFCKAFDRRVIGHILGPS